MDIRQSLPMSFIFWSSKSICGGGGGGGGGVRTGMKQFPNACQHWIIFSASTESQGVITKKHHNPRRPHTVFTPHFIDEFSGHQLTPRPICIFWGVDSTAGCSDGCTSWGLQGVNLEKMKIPENMLWAAALWEDAFFSEHAPHLAHDGQACAKGLAEGTNFGRRCCIGAGELVHYVP